MPLTTQSKANAHVLTASTSGRTLELGPARARKFDAMPETLQREAWLRLRERVEERERAARAEVTRPL